MEEVPVLVYDTAVVIVSRQDVDLAVCGETAWTKRVLEGEPVYLKRNLKAALTTITVPASLSAKQISKFLFYRAAFLDCLAVFSVSFWNQSNARLLLVYYHRLS